MAVLWIDGFDAYGSVGNPSSGLDSRYLVNGEANCNIIDGRLGAQALSMGGLGGCNITTPNLGNIQTWVIGVAMKIVDTFLNVALIELREADNATLGFHLVLQTSGNLSVYRGGTHVQTTTVAPITLGSFAHIEMKVTVANAGSYEVRVNGSTVLSGSVDTQVGASAFANRVRLDGYSTGTSAKIVWDDLYILDDSGSSNNDFLGDRRVITVFPDADGASSDFTPSSGSDNFAMVDENPHDEDTTYVESATSTDRDLYSMAAVDVDTINAVQLVVVARKTDVTNFDIKPVVVSNTTTDVGAAQTVGSVDYAGFHETHETDPDTSAPWTESGINAAQFGFEVG